MYVAGRSNDADVMGRVDYLQFTVTWLLNEEFAEEISRAAENLYALYFSGEVPKLRLINRKEIRSAGIVDSRNKMAFLGIRVERILPYRVCFGHCTVKD